MENYNRDMAIDFIKGVAILSIVLCHLSLVVENAYFYLQYVLSFGQLGCQVFFFFSGYLIMKKNVKFEGIEGIDGFITYVSKKLGGVIIPWYMAIIIYQIISWLCCEIWIDFRYEVNSNPLEIITNFLFLNGLFPFANNNVVFGGWYLGTLVIIWIFEPFLLYVYKRFGVKPLIVMMIFAPIVMIFVGLLLLHNDVARNGFLYFSFINQMPCVLYGMVYYHFEDAVITNGTLNVKCRTAIDIIILGIVIVAFSLRLPYSACIYPLMVSYITGECLQMVRYLGTFNMVKKHNLVVRYLLYCGRDSLYIYLIHILIVWYLQEILWRFVFGKYMNSNIFEIFYIVFSLIFVPIVGKIYKKSEIEIKAIFDKHFSDKCLLFLCDSSYSKNDKRKSADKNTAGGGEDRI